MKNYIKLSVVICALAVMSMGSASAQKLKVATVDIQKVFKGYHRTNEEQQKFSEEFGRLQKENKDRLASIRKIEETLQSLKKKVEDPTLSDKVKRTKAREFQLKLDEAKAMDRERREFLSRRSRALELKKQASMKSILTEIREVIEAHSKKEDFDFVFDKSGVSMSKVPFLLYTKDAADLTVVILAELNKNAPVTKKVTPKATPAKKETK